MRGGQHWWAAVAAAGAALMTGAPAQATCHIGKLLELPVTMRGLKPMAAATVDGRPAQFVVDSGAFYSTISPGAAAEFGLRLEAGPPDFRLNGVGGDMAVKIARVKAFGLANATLHDREFIVGGSETGGAGLLGQNILGVGDVEYDLADGVVRLFQSTGCERASMAYWAADKPVSTVRIESLAEARRHTIGTLELNGVRIRAVFDTGAATSVLTTAAARRAGVTSDGPGVVRAGPSHGLGRKLIQTWVGPFADLKIGDNEEVKQIRLRFGDVSPDDSFDMLLGADFFLSHRVYVANQLGKLFFTYNGGPVFDLTVHRDEAPSGSTVAVAPGGGAPASATPTSADEWSRQGAAHAARRQFAEAIADLTHACDLAPQEARYFRERAEMYRAVDEPARALADLDHVLQLTPDDPESLLARATVRLRHRDRDGARTDLDHAAKALAPAADLRLALAQLYEELDALPESSAQFDGWIAIHPADSRLPFALNGACWTRALSGRELDRALADCNRSLRLSPRQPGVLDSRGLVELRAGNLDAAAKDYGAALAAEPKLAWSLYGRGLIKRRRGDTAGGDADIAAATAIRPGLPDLAKRYGIGG